MKPLAAIVALSRNRGIGRQGRLPWHVPEDLKRFKALTMGHAIIMGRKTHESIGRTLPGRRNVVLSSKAIQIEGCEVVSSLRAALELVKDDALPFVIGGAQVYAEALPHVTHLFLTCIDQEIEADAFFPPLNELAWKEVKRIKGQTSDVTFVDLIRR